MRKFLFFILLLSACVSFAQDIRATFTAPIEASNIFGIDGKRYLIHGGELVAAENVPMLMMDFPSGAAIQVDGITTVPSYTNINGEAHTKVLLDFSLNFDWRGWHPFIQKVAFTGIRTRLELQEEAVYLGSDKRDGVSNYTYAHHGYIVGYSPVSAGGGSFSVSVNPEPYDGEEKPVDHYVVTPTGEKVAERRQYLMIDEKGKITPENAVATIAQATITETRIAAAEVAAVAYMNAAAQTESAVDDLATAIIGNNVVVYEDDFMYSLGDAIAISTNCQCRIYDFKAKTEVVTVDGVKHDRSWVYFGFTENIGSLNPVAQFKDSLTSEIDWGEVVCGTPEMQNHSFVHKGESFDYCYRMYVDIPREYTQAFVRVFTEITAMVGDGSVLNISGGIAGGLTQDVQWGQNTIHFRGGLAIDPSALEVGK